MNASDYITLRGGVTIARQAIETIADLEQRGIHLKRLPEGGLLAYPRHALTDADREAIRRWRFHIEALIAYEPPDEQRVH